MAEDAGPQTVAGWATAISPGPANEAAQTVAFEVTGDTNPALFSAGPAVSPSGDLTYTSAPNANGSATITSWSTTPAARPTAASTRAPPRASRSPSPPVNDVPSFTKGANQTARGLRRPDGHRLGDGDEHGPADESAQTLNFIVTNDNNALFSVQPAIRRGTLTYTPAANAFGSATVTVQIHDNGGTANGGVDTSAPQTFTITVSNYALDFGPSGAAPAYVTFGDPAKLDLAQFTIETWFKRTGAGTGISSGTNGITSAIPLVTHGSPQDDGSNINADWILAIDDATDVIAADFEDMATGANHPVYGTTTIVNNTWYHAAATYDGTTWRLYLNGNLEATLAVNQTPSIRHHPACRPRRDDPIHWRDPGSLPGCDRRSPRLERGPNTGADHRGYQQPADERLWSRGPLGSQRGLRHGCGQYDRSRCQRHHHQHGLRLGERRAVQPRGRSQRGAPG